MHPTGANLISDRDTWGPRIASSGIAFPLPSFALEGTPRRLRAEA
jgi:hypothetical protein